MREHAGRVGPRRGSRERYAAGAGCRDSSRRLYGLIKTGEIVSIRVGRLRRVPVEALAQFTSRLIAEQSRPPDELPVSASPVSTDES